MKTKYIIIVIVCFVILSVCLYLIKIFLKNKDQIVDFDKEILNSFYLTYSNGYAANSYTRYKLSIIDGLYTVEIKPYGEHEDNTYKTTVDNSFINKLTAILKKYEVNKWNGFKESNQNVLDGDSFSLSINFSNNKSINASGYMVWPNNYRNVTSDISKLFMEIYNKKMS